jgi:hypothetical protein
MLRHVGASPVGCAIRGGAPPASIDGSRTSPRSSSDCLTSPPPTQKRVSMTIRLHPNLRWCLALWLGLAIALIGLSSPLRAEAAAGWGPPTLIDSTSQDFISSVSCPSSSFCMAVDGNGNALGYDGTAWASPHNIDARMIPSPFHARAAASAWWWTGTAMRSATTERRGPRR